MFLRLASVRAATLACLWLALGPSPAAAARLLLEDSVVPGVVPIAEAQPLRECRRADLDLVHRGPTETEPPYRIGEGLRIRASGGCAERLRAQMRSGRTGPPATLVLDQVEMKGLREGVPVQDGPDALLLSFRLSRDSQDDDSRNAWDALLSKQHQGYTMTLPVAVSIAGETAVGVRSESLRLKIADTAGIAAMLLGGIALLFGLLYILIKRSNALRDEPGGRYSLGKSQMAFWGLLIVLCFVGVFILTGAMEKIPDQVLVLLGISGATGLGAVLIGAGKTPPAVQRAELESQRQTRNLTVAELAQLVKVNEHLAREQALAAAAAEASPRVGATLKRFFADICDDGNGISVHRLQVVVWTLVLGAVFVWNVAQVMSMPQFPQTLLILLGISNGTYLGFKLPER